MTTKRKKTSAKSVRKTGSRAAETRNAAQAGKTSGTKYVLVDFENVQPRNLELLKEVQSGKF